MMHAEAMYCLLRASMHTMNVRPNMRVDGTHGRATRWIFHVAGSYSIGHINDMRNVTNAHATRNGQTMLGLSTEDVGACEKRCASPHPMPKALMKITNTATIHR